MIASSRLRNVERVAKAEYDRYYRDRPTSAELAASMRELYEQAKACEARGDLDNEIVRRADRMGELIGIARRRKEEAEAATRRSSVRGNGRSNRDGAPNDI